MDILYEMINYGVLIIEGYFNWAIDSIRGKISPLAQKRLDICNKCEFKKHGICSKCGCVLKAKVRCDFQLDENQHAIDGCPENKW